MKKMYDDINDEINLEILEKNDKTDEINDDINEHKNELIKFNCSKREKFIKKNNNKLLNSINVYFNKNTILIIFILQFIYYFLRGNLPIYIVSKNVYQIFYSELSIIELKINIKGKIEVFNSKFVSKPDNIKINGETQEYINYM